MLHQILWLRHAIFYLLELEASENSNEDMTFYFVKLEDSKNSDEDESF